AMAGLSVDRPIPVRLETDLGNVHCEVDARGAPQSVALFVGLATGRASWKNPVSGDVERRSLYENRKFFRAVPGMYVQSGCPRDDGTGHPGYRIPVEARLSDSDVLARPGAILLARYTPPPRREDPNPPP